MSDPKATHPAAHATSTAGRFHAIDALRALAMFLGVVLHASLGFMKADVSMFTPRMDRSRWVMFDLGVYGIHAFRMQLFFVVAGFFTALLLSRRTPWRFAQGRAVRIVLPLVVGAFTIVPLTAMPFLRAYNIEPTLESLCGHPSHLWFLVYLCCFSAAAFVCAAVAHRWPVLSVGRVFSWLGACANSPLSLILMSVPTVLLTLLMPTWIIQTPRGWAPDWNTLLYYGFFFCVGWAVQRRDLAATIGRGWMWQLPLTILVFFPAMLWAGETYKPDTVAPTDYGAFLIAASIEALFTWGMILSLFGVFVRVCPGERAWVRWLADSSYWVYLTHLPAVYWLQYFFANKSVPAMSAGPLEACVKFAGILAAVTAFTLVTYAVLVRPTPLERVLGGRVQRREG